MIRDVTTEILVLANSYKMGRRCLAGVDGDGRWIRPVADRHGDGLLESHVTIGGRLLAPGDSVRLSLGDAVPLIFQEENILLENSRIDLTAPLPNAELQRRLARLAADVPPFARSSRSSLDTSTYEFGFSARSLALLFTEDLTIEWRVNVRGTLRPRAIFATAEGAWDLPYTGEQSWEFPPRTAAARRSYGAAYVTTSVGETIDDGSTHYILAAGVVAAN